MKIKFIAEVEVPDGTPEADVEAWLRFHLGETGELPAGNALQDSDLMSVGCRRVELRTW